MITEKMIEEGYNDIDEIIGLDNKEIETTHSKENIPVGRIDFLGSNGIIGESIEYYDPQKFKEIIKQECWSGAPINVVFYKDSSGKTISQNFILGLDTLPKGVCVEEITKAEVLTAGLLRELISDRNIPELKKLIEGKSDDTALNLIDRNDYIATKLWTREDIAQRLYEMDYPNSDAYIDAVLNHGSFKHIEECSDSEWNVIDEAIIEASGYYELPKEIKVQGPISCEEYMEFPFKFEENLPPTVAERLSVMDREFEEGKIYIAGAEHTSFDNFDSKTYYTKNLIYAVVNHDGKWQNASEVYKDKSVELNMLDTIEHCMDVGTGRAERRGKGEMFLFPPFGPGYYRKELPEEMKADAEKMRADAKKALGLER